MSQEQKTVLIIALIGIAVVAHFAFCDWDSGYGSSKLTLIDRGELKIEARSMDTTTLDALLGLVLPATVVGLACFLMAKSTEQD